ncbi:MAG TPA: DUF3093 family protein [Streptosporangiaceae bacterium]
MRVYHERLWVPVSWLLLGLLVVVLLSAELSAGAEILIAGTGLARFAWPIGTGVYVVIIGLFAVLMLNWGRARVEITGTVLTAAGAALPLAAAGEVTALDQRQTRALRGPRADPSAFCLIRPYLREAVYIAVTDRSLGQPYWLVATRHPARLAAAINGSRPAARTGDAAVG